LSNQYLSCASLNVENVLIICFTGYCDVCLELFWCVQQNKDVPVALNKLY